MAGLPEEKPKRKRSQAKVDPDMVPSQELAIVNRRAGVWTVRWSLIVDRCEFRAVADLRILTSRPTPTHTLELAGARGFAARLLAEASWEQVVGGRASHSREDWAAVRTALAVRCCGG